MKTSIYFMALLPQQEIQDEVTEFKQYAAQKFKTKRALTSPPHVTLVSPFKYEDEKISEIVTTAQIFASQQKAFDIELKDFNCFAPRVIYVDVMTSDTMNTMYQNLNHALEKDCGIEFQYKDREFHPHMTVAFKDLKEAMFPKAWKYFRRAKYKRTFTANALTLLKHNGKNWEVLENYNF